MKPFLEEEKEKQLGKQRKTIGKTNGNGKVNSPPAKDVTKGKFFFFFFFFFFYVSR